MKRLFRIAVVASLVLAASLIAPATASAGTNITDCYYSGGYRGCTYFKADPNPEVLTVCDAMIDGRYTKGRLKFGGSVWEFGPVYDGLCVRWELSLEEWTHIGIRTGIEGLGWTEYEYGYA
jgi:hypothetical protein